MVFIVAMLAAQLPITAGTPGAGLSLDQAAGSVETLQEAIPVVPVDRDAYRLAPGDMLLVTIEGGVSEYLLSVGVLPMDQCQVTLDGRLNVSGIGSLHVEGRSINEAQAALDAQVRSCFPSLRAGLSLSFPRMINVEVRGMVDSPGRYSMYATQRVSDAIREAGGVRLYGGQFGRAFRDSGEPVSVDLSLDPSTGVLRSDPMLDGLVMAEVFPCGHPVFILSSEGLSTHDIGPGGMSVSDLMAEAVLVDGDVDLPASYVSVVGGGTVPVWRWDGGYTEYSLSPGDTLNLVPEESTVFVGGAVQTPGLVLFRPGAGVDWYIQAAGGFSTEANTREIRVTHSGGVLEVDSRDSLPIPGNSSIEVGYSWMARNRDYVTLFATLAGLAFSVIQLTQ
jgi:protein involved in polysaccharide export with SLBB domain